MRNTIAGNIKRLDREHLKDFLTRSCAGITLNPGTLTARIHYEIPLRVRNRLASPRGFEPTYSPWFREHRKGVAMAESAVRARKVKPFAKVDEARIRHADTRITAKHYAHLADKTLALAVTKLPAFSGVAKPYHFVKVSS